MNPLLTCSAFWRSRILLIDEIDKSDINFSNDLLHIFETVYIGMDSSPTHLPKTQLPKKECPGLTDLLVTSHPLWWRSLTPISDRSFFIPIFITHNLLKNLRREIRGFSDRYFTKKSASPAGMFRGCEGIQKHSCDEARPPPKRARA